MYSVLLFSIGHLQQTCAAHWPEQMHPWAAIFLADYLRGYIEAQEFMRLFAMVNSDYIELAACIVGQ